MKVAILLDDFWVQKWMFDAIEPLTRDKSITIETVIKKEWEGKQNSIYYKVNKKRSSLFFTAFNKLFLKKNCPSLSLVDIRPSLVLSNIINVKPIKTGKYREIFPNNIIDELRSSQIDIIVRFGFGIIEGEILTVAKYGVLSYHHGNPAEYRGGPPVFWEYINGEKEVGAILQRLSPELDGGTVLRSGSININHSYSLTFDRLYSLSSMWLYTVIKEFSEDRSNEVNIKSLGKVYKLPTNLTFILLFNQMLKRRLYFYLKKYFYLDTWDTFFISQENISIENIVNHGLSDENLKASQPIGFSSKESFFADPCLFLIGSKVHVLTEFFSYRRPVGIIRLFKQLLNGEFGELELKYNHEIGHLSFPQIIPNSENLFTFENCCNEGLLIGCLKNNKLTFVRQILGLEGRRLVDPLIIFQEGVYFLLFSDVEFGEKDSLCCYMKKEIHDDKSWVRADNFLTSLSPHNSRLAGNTFNVDGQAYIPAQECCYSYGNAIKFNQLSFEPEPYIKHQGATLPKVHTFNYLPGVGLVFDLKKSVFTISKLILKVMRVFKLN